MIELHMHLIYIDYRNRMHMCKTSKTKTKWYNKYTRVAKQKKSCIHTQIYKSRKTKIKNLCSVFVVIGNISGGKLLELGGTVLEAGWLFPLSLEMEKDCAC